MSTFGRAIGTTLLVQNTGYSNVTRHITGKAGVVSKITVKLDGAGPGTGPQQIKALIYSDNGAGLPNALLGTSAEVTVTDGQVVGEVDFTFAAGIYVAASTYYHLGFI